MVKKLLVHFKKKNCRRKIKKKLGWKKSSKETEINYTLNGKGIIAFNSWIDKKDLAE